MMDDNDLYERPRHAARWTSLDGQPVAGTSGELPPARAEIAPPLLLQRPAAPPSQPPAAAAPKPAGEDEALQELADRMGCTPEEAAQAAAESAPNIFVQQYLFNLAKRDTANMERVLGQAFGWPPALVGATVNEFVQQSRWVFAMQRDLWQWRAIYQDGSVLDEYRRREAREWSDVDQSRLAGIELVPQHWSLPVHRLSLLPGQQGCCFRKRVVLKDDKTEQSLALPAITVVGWETPTASAYTAYFWDGTVLSFSDLSALNEWT